MKRRDGFALSLRPMAAAGEGEAEAEEGGHRLGAVWVQSALAKRQQ